MDLLGGLLGQKKPAEAPAARGEAIESSLERFASDVLEASMSTPVLVDFWAPWCGPCKQLGPILEKAVKQAKGRVRLVKIDIDKDPELAQQMGVQSVPTVFAFVGGRPVTGFQGAQPESQIKLLIEKLAGGPLEDDVASLLEAAQAALDEGALDQAAEMFARAHSIEPDHLGAIAGLARARLAAGDLAGASEALALAPADKAEAAEIEGARAALDLAREAGELRPEAAIEAELAADPNAHAARAERATALFLRGRADEAIDELLTIVRKDREWDEDGARKRLLRLFDALGPSHPAALKGRRKLSSTLFS